MDEPSIESIQTLILLTISCLILGQGKKCWMRLGAAIRMTLALELHDETSNFKVPKMDKEIARRCFFTCYLLDRFSVCGSRRPMLIIDDSLLLRLPSMDDGNSSCFFKALSNYQMTELQENNLIAMLIDITRILGKTNNYIQQGGVRGDTHFPWHSKSTLSVVVNELKSWDLRFSSVTLDIIDLRHKSGLTTWFFSWFIYHLIYVRIYRAFLPIAMEEDKFENSTWQAEVTSVCLRHANSIVGLADSAIAYDIAFQPFTL